MMNKAGFLKLLLGKDLRTIGQNEFMVYLVNDQVSFDELFSLLFHHERPVVMRAADAVEKITRKHPEFLETHKLQLIAVLKSADHKELKWHVAQLVPRLPLDNEELKTVWNVLSYWLLNKNESKIVRVNALQGLYDLSVIHPDLKVRMEDIISEIEHEMIPSLQARLRKLKNPVNTKYAQTHKT